MFRPKNRHRKACHQRAFRTEIHRPTTNHILYHKHLRHLETPILRVICNQAYLRLYLSVSIHPTVVKNKAWWTLLEILKYRSSITGQRYVQNPFSCKFQNRPISNAHNDLTTYYPVWRLCNVITHFITQNFTTYSRTYVHFHLLTGEQSPLNELHSGRVRLRRNKILPISQEPQKATSSLPNHHLNISWFWQCLRNYCSSEHSTNKYLACSPSPCINTDYLEKQNEAVRSTRN